MQTRPSHRILLVALVVVVCAGGTAGTGAAAEFEDRDNGFYLGLRLATSFLRIQHIDPESFTIRKTGAGLELLAGYSFNPIFSLQIEIVGAGHSTSDPDVKTTFGAFQLFAHYRARPGRPVRPYLKGGLGAYGFAVDNRGSRVTSTGPGIPVGAGVDYFFNRHISLGLDLTHHVIEYDKLEFDVDGKTVGFEIDESGGQTAVGLAFRAYF